MCHLLTQKNTNTDAEIKDILNQNEMRNSSKRETIYANSNVIHDEHIDYNPHTVPVGRKPALPPKPPNPLRLSLLKPKGYSCIAANSKGKSSKIKLDPAELSLKERLALFEKNKNASLVPEILGSQPKMLMPAKQLSINAKRRDLYSSTNLIKTIHHQKTIICGNIKKSSVYFTVILFPIFSFRF